MILPLELSEDGEEIRAEEARNVRPHELLELWPAGGSQALELLDHEEALLPHLLFPPPDRQARARSQRGGGKGVAAAAEGIAFSEAAVAAIEAE